MGFPCGIIAVSAERARLDALLRYRILDTPPEPAFDRITQMTRQIFHAPIAWISFVDGEREWIKSCSGMDPVSLPRELSLAAQVIRSESVVVVPDALADPCLAAHPLVAGPPHLRFYAGAPLRNAQGIPVGALAFTDTSPREAFDDRQKAVLSELAAAVMDQLEFRAAKRAEAPEAHESEDRFRALSACFPDGIFMTDLEGRWTYANPRCQAIGGFTLQECLGEGWLRFVHPEDRDGLAEEWFAAAAGEDSYSRQLRFENAEGAVRWVHLRSAPMWSSDGHPIGRVGTIEDVTEAGQAEEALRLANQNLRTVIQTSPLAIVAIDLGGRVKFWNPAAERLFGWKEEEVLDRFVPSIPDDQMEDFLGLLKGYREGQSLSGVERRRVRKDGAPVDVSLWTAPLRDAGGGIAGTLGVFVDITERKRLEEQFRQSQTLDAVCEILEAQSPGLLGSILLLDETGLHLRHGAAPSLPESYTRELDGMKIGPEAHAAGVAVFRREPVFAADIAADPLWVERRALVRRHGLRACWAVPILGGDGSVLGALVAYHREPRSPSPQDLELLDRAVRLAAILIERLQAEQALWDSEERYRRLFEDNPLPMWVFGLDTLGFLAVNDAAVRHYGYSREEFCAMTVRDILAPEDVPRLFETVSRATESIDLSGRWKHKKKDGAVIDVETTAFTLMFAGRSAALLQANDITRRKRAEEALRDSEQKYRSLFEESRDAILITNREGESIDANQAALDLFGYTKEEIPFISMRDIYVDPRERLRFQQELEQNGSVRDFEVLLRTKDGQAMNCLVTATLRHSKDGRLLGYQKIIRDITARKQAERAVLELSGRLLQLQDEERRRIARELHDSTAQTLAALAMNISLLKMELGADLAPKLQKLLSDSHALAGQCSRELRTISHLLHPPLLDEMGLASALRSYADGFSRRSGIHTELEVPPDLRRLPRELETALFRIVQESLTNIHKHSGSPTAAIRLAQGGGEIRVEVEDRGRGIPPGILETGREITVRGLGVGIPGMRERVRQLGGRLEIQSGSGGTTVRAILPAANRP